MTRQLCVAALMGSLLLAGGSASLAQPKHTSDSGTKEARKAYKEGSALFVEGRFVAAIELFEKAYELSPNFRVQCNIALCYQSLGNAVEAAGRYRRCLREGGNKSKFADEITASLGKMEKLIVHVEVTSPGEGGTVYLDGERKGRPPRRLAVNPGSHVVEVRRRHARTARATIKVAGGETQELSLVPLPEVQMRVQVPETQPTLPSRRRVPSYWFWAGAGLSVALATVAIVLGVQTLGLRDDYMSKPSPDSYNTFLDRRLLTNIFAFTAGAVAAGSTVLFFFTDFKGRSKEQPAARASMLGVGLQGTF